MTFDPFGVFGKGAEVWQKLADESVQRTTSFWTELDKVEAKGAERTGSTIDELARMSKESLAYSHRLGSEWRKLAFESWKDASTQLASGLAGARPSA